MDALIIETVGDNHEYNGYSTTEPSEILSQWLGALECRSSLYWYHYSEAEDVFEMSPTCKSIAHRDSDLIAAIAENCTHGGPVCYFCR